MYPTLQAMKQLTAEGGYRRIPLCREILSDRFTPVEVMRILRKAHRHCFLLESAGQKETWGRYSFLGYEPSMEITCMNGAVTIRSIHDEKNTEGTAEKNFQNRKVAGDETIGRNVQDAENEEEMETAHPGEILRKILREYKSPTIEALPPFT